MKLFKFNFLKKTVEIKLIFKIRKIKGLFDNIVRFYFKM